MRRIVMALAVVALLVGFSGPSPVAGAEWCDTDPLVLVVTPGGALVPIFVTNGALGVEHLLAATLASMHYTAAPARQPGMTDVEIRVLVQHDLFDTHFPTRTVASTGPLGTGAIYARAEGRSGRTMVMRFTLAIP
jgi:hypothetical protein